jgi:hypothetical protein
VDNNSYRVGSTPLGKGGFSRPLNRYFTNASYKPNTDLPLARCPMDVGSYGVNAITPAPTHYEWRGTSYEFNTDGDLPWGGYGIWVRRNGAVSAFRRDGQDMEGPNFRVDRVSIQSSRFVVAGDAAAWITLAYGNQIPQVGRWHEKRLGPKWTHGNALFLDTHVGFRSYDLSVNSDKTGAAKYVFSTHSLYPMRALPD